MNCPAYHHFFRNLANPIKIKIIGELKVKDSSVNDLSKKLHVEQSKLSHALASLKACNIVLASREGKNIIYSLNKNTILPILKIIDKHKCKYCGVKH
jgi:DNA-binding transcriptional ArsR family regulator